MSAATKFWVSVTDNPEMARTFHVSFGVPNEPPRWITDRGSRRIFTNRQEASIAGHEMLVEHLNNAAAVQERSAVKTGSKIRSFRVDSAQPIKRRRTVVSALKAEAEVVFANFGKGSP